jgi:hypothetical protein
MIHPQIAELDKHKFFHPRIFPFRARNEVTGQIPLLPSPPPNSPPTAPIPNSPPVPKARKAKPNPPTTQSKPHSPAAPSYSPTDDACAYEDHVTDLFKELRPMGARECALVQLLADNAWRLDRVFALEMGIYALGRTQLADHFSDEDPALQPNLIEVHTFLTYEKQLRNLQLQFGRLCRQREKDTAELSQLQQERIKHEKQELETAAKLYTAAKHDRKPFDPAEFGLDCSLEDVECYLNGVRAANLLNATLKQERDQARSRSNAA